MSAPKPSGSPLQKPVIFLHGFLGSGGDWQPIAARLPPAYRPYLPDLPGHGRNRPPLPAQAVKFPEIEKEVLALVETLPATDDRPVLVGYSMGGRLALNFACAHPERLAGLVLESAGPGITDPAARRERAAQDDARAAQILEAGLPAFLKKWYAAPLWDSLAAHPEKKEALLTRRSRSNPAWMAKIIADLSPGRTPDRWPCLPGLPLPVLLLAGALDTKYAAMAPRAASLIPDGRCEIVPGAGHNIHLEDPEAFIARLLPFLARVFGVQVDGVDRLP